MRSLHTLTRVFLFFCTLNTHGTLKANNLQQQYFIDTYIPIAIEEMQRSGIPASIKMAQAILESNWGRGTAVIKGNNFFCIKCNNNWTGDTLQMKDDEPGLSCFRVYDNALASFKDHTDFLLTNLRYRKLFEHNNTDYVSWARGLKECGYATDSMYDQKLIDLIEQNGLFIYDYAVPLTHFKVLKSKYLGQEESNDVYSGFSNRQESGSNEDRLSTYQNQLGFNSCFNESVLAAPTYRVGKSPLKGSELEDSMEGSYHFPSEVPSEYNSVKHKSKILPITPLPDNYLK